MADLADGESTEMKGSARKPYVLRNVGGVYSCSCPAWRNQSEPIERRTCKHLRKLRGDAAEKERLGGAIPRRSTKSKEKPEGPPLLLAHPWDSWVDLDGWWMSEKLDGVRAYWDGKRFLSRQGNEFLAPEWFTADFPDVPLDGELWIDRKAFQRTVSVVRRQDRSDHWKEVRYLIFDAPAQEERFEERLEYLKDLLGGRDLTHGTVLEQQLCRGLDHLKEELARVEALGGEGLMLREPGSSYEVGRSHTLLKVKNFRDAEAEVVDHQAGKGKFKGMLGAVVARLEDGTEFSIGTGFSNKERKDPPPVGSRITFRYQELSDAGVPRFPSYVRLHSLPEAGAGTAPPAAPPPAPEATGTGGTRRFEFSEGKSDKFWEVTVDGVDVTVRYGRIGTKGQTRTKSFADPEKASAHAEKQIEKKTAKGYREAS